MSVLTNLVTAWLVLQVSIDVFVTGKSYLSDGPIEVLIVAVDFSGTLGILLARSRTGFRKTDTVINRLIRGAIQTGLFAGLFSLGDLITFALVPATNFYGMFAIPIGRIYTNVSITGCNRRSNHVLTFERPDTP